MKILYVAGAPQADYQADSLFHGLRSEFGADVVDVLPRWHMYRGADLSKCYGRGFSLFGLIEEGEVDRTEIPAKLRAKYFDFVIFGSIQREFSILGEVWESYPPSKIIFIDGEDNPQVMIDIVSKGIMFKRELHSPHEKVFPIQFGFPEEKIQSMQAKTQLMAPLDPVDTTTYIYNDEQSYYDSYRSAMFGKTMKKAGWECMRHLEIMACRCIPWFVNLEFCPPTIMTRSPKNELLVAKSMLEYNRGELFMTASGANLWVQLEHKIFEHFKQHLTTAALAKYVLETAQKAAA